MGFAHFDNPSASLQPGAYGRFVAANSSDAKSGLAPTDHVMQGSLEESNGNPVLQMANMIQAARKWSRDEAPHGGDGRDGTCRVVSYLFSQFALSAETAVDVLIDGDDCWNETNTKYPWGRDEDDANGGSNGESWASLSLTSYSFPCAGMHHP